MLKPKITIAVLSVPLLAGCGNAAKSQPIGTESSVGPNGNVSGQFIAVGGPPQAQNNPQQGTVTLTDTKTHAVFNVATGADGLFALTVPPGTYTATGHTPQYIANGHEGLCQAYAPIRVYTGDPVAVTVACQRD